MQTKIDKTVNTCRHNPKWCKDALKATVAPQFSGLIYPLKKVSALFHIVYLQILFSMNSVRDAGEQQNVVSAPKT